jgi:hypothetical protein
MRWLAQWKKKTKTGRTLTIKKKMDDQVFQIWKLIFQNKLEKTKTDLDNDELEELAVECMVKAKRVFYDITT